MLPLSADRAPANAQELTEALQRGLQAQGLTPRAVEAAGSAYPSLSELRLDLSDSALTHEFRPKKAQGEKVASLQVARVEILGQPIFFERTPLTLQLQAQSATAGLYLEDGNGCLTLESAVSGELLLEVGVEALEAALHRLAVEAAAKQGVEVKQTKVSFTQESPGAVSFRVEVKAKVFIMSAALALTGRLDLDASLNARVSALSLDGDSMVLKLVGGFAKPHLDRLEGRTISLASFTPAGMKVREIELSAGPQLKLRAVFGAD